MWGSVKKLRGGQVEGEACRERFCSSKGECMSWRGTGSSKTGIYSRSWVMRGSAHTAWGGRRRRRGREGAHVCQRPGAAGSVKRPARPCPICDQPVTLGRAAAAGQGHTCSPGSRRWHGPRPDGDSSGPASLRKLSGSWSTPQGCHSSVTQGERTIRT